MSPAVSLSHSSLMEVHSSFLLLYMRPFTYTRFVKEAQTFSIGDKSGDCGGQGKTSISCVFKYSSVYPDTCIGALSCWKIELAGKGELASKYAASHQAQLDFSVNTCCHSFVHVAWSDVCPGSFPLSLFLF